jgi:hypothetical protein
LKKMEEKTLFNGMEQTMIFYRLAKSGKDNIAYGYFSRMGSSKQHRF